MRLQALITVVTGVLTVGFIALSADHVHWNVVTNLPSGSGQEFVGALIFVATAFGLGWVNAAADYSRYLPRSASSRGVMWWTTLGAGVGPGVLLIFGLLIAGSSDKLNSAIAADPIGALATILPTWFLVPFVVVSVLGLVAGAVMDIYSSGLSLLNAGLRAPRFVAVGIDGTLMVLGAIYVVFFSQDFLVPFQGFLITLGVPIAAWCGVFVADIALRRRDYSERDLFSRHGRYGDIRWMPVALIVVATVLGWGLVTNTLASWLSWQGYLLGPLGLGGVKGAWAYANLGVIVALVLGFVGYLVLGRRSVQAQESLPVEAEVPLTNREAQEIEEETVG
jgi:purine-cytosine permease-like protein